MYYINNISLFATQDGVEAQVLFGNTEGQEDKVLIPLSIDNDNLSLRDLEYGLITSCEDNFWRSIDSATDYILKEARSLI